MRLRGDCRWGRRYLNGLGEHGTSIHRKPYEVEALAGKDL